MKAVVDNNLIVSGLLWDGLPSRLMEAVRDGRVQMVLSPELYVELEDVLRRKKLTGRLAARGTTPEKLLSTIRAMAEMVFPEPLPLPPNLRDADDLAVLECAVSARADVIITGDKDLLVLSPFSSIPIIKVRDALEKLGVSVE